MKRLNRRKFSPSCETLEQISLLSALVVTNLADSGPGSLRSEVEISNNTTGPNTITFAPGLQGQISLTSGEIDIRNNNLTITGSPNIAINALGNSRIFDMDGGLNVTLANLSMVNGHSAVGGAISDTNCTLNVAGCTFNGNKSDGWGGAIYAGPASHLNVTASSFLNNVSKADTNAGGGAIANQGIMTMTGDLFVGNSGDNGGAVLNVLAISDTETACTYARNQAKGGGAGFNILTNHVTLNTDYLLSNHAGIGGGIFNTSSNLVLNNDIIQANQATFGSGGGIYSTGGSLVTSGGVINLNDSVMPGGGIFAQIGTLTLAPTTTVLFNRPDDVVQV